MSHALAAAAFAILLVSAAAIGGHAADRGAPATAVDGVTDVYHGVTVADPYRWLENAKDSRVRDWSAAQDDRTRAYLDALPARKPIYDRLMNAPMGCPFVGYLTQVDAVL